VKEDEVQESLIDVAVTMMTACAGRSRCSRIWSRSWLFEILGYINWSASM